MYRQAFEIGSSKSKRETATPSLVGDDNIPTGCFQHENRRNSTGRPEPNATLKFEQHLAKAKNTVPEFQERQLAKSKPIDTK